MSRSSKYCSYWFLSTMHNKTNSWLFGVEFWCVSYGWCHCRLWCNKQKNYRKWYIRGFRRVFFSLSLDYYTEAYNFIHLVLKLSHWKCILSHWPYVANMTERKGVWERKRERANVDQNVVLLHTDVSAVSERRRLELNLF